MNQRGQIMKKFWVALCLAFFAFFPVVTVLAAEEFAQMPSIEEEEDYPIITDEDYPYLDEEYAPVERPVPPPRPVAPRPPSPED